jgi:hypothetical protein
MSALRSLALAALAALIAAPLAGQVAAGNRVEVLALSPEPGERVAEDQVMVAAAFVDAALQIDPGSIRIDLDGRDVTAEAEISAEVAIWRPRTPLLPGPHRVTVSARTRDGRAVSPAFWAFTVESAAESAAARLAAGAASTSFTRFQGSVTFEGSSLSVSGPGAGLRRNEDQVPRLWINVGGALGGGWRYGARVHLSGYESSSGQPVNRFRFDLRSSWLSLAAGDVNPVFQDLILSGARVRGVEGSIKGGPFRLSVVRGSTRRAVEAQLNPTATAVLLQGTYGQSLFAVRPVFGGQRFQVGLTAMRVKDDVESIDDLRVPGTLGSTRRVNPAPKDNLVAGADVTLRLIDGRLLLQYENAGSVLANDISGGPITEEQLDSILADAGEEPIDVNPADFERFFTLNASIIPLDPRGMTSVAQQASASLRTGTNIFTAEWRSIGGSYYTLAQPTVIRDRRGIRIRDSFTLMDDALAVAAGFETDEDNLDEVKPATTTTQNIFATASWQQSPTTPTVVASLRTGSRSNDLARGQVGALDESSLGLSLGLGIPVNVFEGIRTRINTNVAMVNRDDPSNTLVESRDRYILAGVQGETQSRSSAVSLMYGLNKTELVNVPNATTDFHRIVANGRHLVAPRWVVTLDGTLTSARSPDAAGATGLEYNRAELMGGAEFEWTAASFVTLLAGVVDYADQRVPGRDTREIVVRLRVHREF